MGEHCRLACPARLLRVPRITCLGTELLTVGWALPPQSSSKKMPHKLAIGQSY